MAHKPSLHPGVIARPTTDDRTPREDALKDGMRKTNVMDHSNNHLPENPVSMGFWYRLEDLKNADSRKNTLLEELVVDYTLLEQKHNNLVANSERDLTLATEAVAREKQVQSDFNSLVNLLNRDGFLIVLIDGNDLVFNDDLLRAGKEGGKRAAEFLAAEVRAWAAEHVCDCPGDVKLAIRVFADVNGIAHACWRAGIITTPLVVHDFVRGFRNCDPLFDFTDVGAGKDMVFLKVNAVFQLHLHDYQCRHIFFGCNRDIKYASLLQQYRTDNEIIHRLALLQGTQLDSGLAQLPLRRVAMPVIFRQAKIMPAGPATPPEPSPTARLSLDPRSEIFSPVRITHNGTPAQLPEHTPQVRLLQTQASAPPSSTRTARTESLTSSTTSSDLPNGLSASAVNWSMVASRAAALPFKDLTRPLPPVKPSVAHVAQNKAGQRVDMPMPYDHERVAEVKKMKYCNQHYIGRGCHHWKAEKTVCPHRHDDKLSKEDLKWLRVVARETVCRQGTGCDEIECIYGHSCPYPKKDDSPVCTNGPSCRFPPEMHGMDTKVAKYLTAATLKT